MSRAKIPELKDVAKALNIKLPKRDGLGLHRIWKGDVEMELVKGGKFSTYRSFSKVTLVMKTGGYRNHSSRRFVLYDGQSVMPEIESQRPVSRALTAEEKKQVWAKYRELAKIAKANEEARKRAEQQRKAERDNRDAMDDAFEKAGIEMFSGPVTVDCFKYEFKVSFRGKTPAEALEMYHKLQEAMV